MNHGGDPKDVKRDGTGCIHLVLEQGESEATLEMLEFLLGECGCPLTGGDKYGASPYVNVFHPLKP
jgi:hypothetical protein